MSSFTNPLTQRIAAFLESIGVPVIGCSFDEPSFLPGVLIDRGRLLVDEEKLLSPGDLLHEAGHIAMLTGSDRAERHHDVTDNLGDEIGAIAWSYAALLFLELEPTVVFHAEGYRGASENYIDNFSQGRFVGVPLLQWMGLTLDEKNARQQGLPPYPHMVQWLRE